jgi:hypothetical protein
MRLVSASLFLVAHLLRSLSHNDRPRNLLHDLPGHTSVQLMTTRRDFASQPVLDVVQRATSDELIFGSVDQTLR